MTTADKVHNIRYCVFSAMNRIDLSDMRLYERLETFAIEYYRDHIKSHGIIINPKVFYAKMDALRLVKVPDDFVHYSVIGLIRNGRVWTLGLDNRIPLVTGLSPCSDTFQQVSVNPTQASPGIFISPHIYQGRYIDTLYSQGGGFNEAYYRYDPTNRVIQFDTKLPQSEVVIEYMSNGFEASGDTIVGGEFVPVIREYIIREYQRFSKNYNQADIALTQINFEEYELKAKAINGRSLQEMLDALYRTNGARIR